MSGYIWRCCIFSLLNAAATEICLLQRQPPQVTEDDPEAPIFYPILRQASPRLAWDGQHAIFMPPVRTPTKFQAGDLDMLETAFENVMREATAPAPTVPPILARAKLHAQVGRVMTWILMVLVALLMALMTLVNRSISAKDATAGRKGFRAGRNRKKQLEQVLLEFEDEEGYICEKEFLDADVYGFAIAVLVRDLIFIVSGRGQVRVRAARLVVSQGMLLVNMILQMYLLTQVLHLCASKSVHDIRTSYSDYEWKMYGEDQINFVDPEDKVNRRGMPIHFNASGFDGMHENLKEVVCNIPFSQPFFILVLLFVWTLTCTKEIKAIIDLFFSLIVNTPTSFSMAACLEHVEEADVEGEDTVPRETNPSVNLNALTRVAHINLQRCEYVCVASLTARVKGYILGFILFPRMLLTVSLVYVGCRWLTSTADFGELVLNTVALEFVLNLKTLLYMALVSNRNKRELRHTLIQPPNSFELVTAYNFLANFLWFFVAVLWCLAYVYYLQQVLPEYNWDASGPCESWIEKNMLGT